MGDERIRIDPVPATDREAPERGESFRYSRAAEARATAGPPPWRRCVMRLRHRGEDTARAPLGRAFGARSGDKGGNANLGVWARTDDAYVWLHRTLTVERLRELMPAETEGLEVTRYELPNLRAINFVIVGLLGRGVAASTRTDPQAKGLGEYLRAKVVDLPTAAARRGAGCARHGGCAARPPASPTVLTATNPDRPPCTSPPSTSSSDRPSARSSSGRSTPTSTSGRRRASSRPTSSSPSSLRPGCSAWSTTPSTAVRAPTTATR